MTTRFDAKTHTYYIDGKPATGVTTIIGDLAKPALIGWAAKMAVEYVKENIDRVYGTGDDGTPQFYEHLLEELLHEAKTAHTKKKEAAGTHGKDAHALVEKYVKNCIDVSLNGIKGAPLAFGFSHEVNQAWEPIAPFVNWAVENVDYFLFSERRMFNKELFIAGTADFAYVGKDGKKYMADFKTSSGIYGIDYWLQVAAYRFLAEAEGDEPYDGATIVRLGKDGSFEVQQLYDYETYKEAFMACLTLYRAQAAIKGMVVH